MLPTTLANGAPSVNRLGSILDQFFGSDFASGTTAIRSTLPLAAWDDENAVYVEADLPGVNAADVDVSVHGRMLTIKGERKLTHPEKGFDTRPTGAFEQRLGLPAPVEADRVEASLINGVLKLTLPKSEAAKPRKIEVRN